MFSIPNPVQSSALACPDAAALGVGDQVLTWRQLLQAVRQRAAWLITEHHIKPGQTVALLGPPDLDWLVCLHAVGWIGATLLPLAFKDPLSAHQPTLEAVRPHHLVLTGSKLEIDQARLLYPGAVAWHAHGSLGDLAPERFWPLDEVRFVILTSGTTAAPRAVPVQVAQLVFSAFGSALRLGHKPGDTWLLCLPLHHIGGLSIVMRAAWAGANVRLLAPFDPVAVAQSLDAGAINLVSLVPAMLEAILTQRGEGPFAPALRAILLGGAAAPSALLQRCAAHRLPVCLTWGMSESASQVATTWPGRWQAPGDCGPPLAFARVDAPGGVLQIAGPVVAGGHLPTQDLGDVAADGRVRVLGRRDDVIVSGGENISPEEIEAVVAAHPAIAECCVVPVKHAHWGERPVALLVGRVGAARPTDDALRQWCRKHLAAFKTPDRFVWRSALPRSDLGKISRRSLADALGQTKA